MARKLRHGAVSKAPSATAKTAALGIWDRMRKQTSDQQAILKDVLPTSRPTEQSSHCPPPSSASKQSAYHIAAVAPHLSLTAAAAASGLLNTS